MLEWLFLLKFASVVLLVLFLSVLTDKTGPRYSGLISGMPTGSAITLFFIGLELSPAFASQSALFNLAGMTAMQVFVYLYYRASNSLRSHAVLLSSLIAACGFFLTIFLLHAVVQTEITAILIPLITTPLFMYAMKGVPEAKVDNPAKLNLGVLLLRAAIAASIILFVVWLAPMVGPELAGLFSSFPTTLFPLMLITHMTYGTRVNSALVKNVSKSHFSMMFFSLTVFYAFPLFGAVYGILLALGAAVAYLAAYHFIGKMLVK